MNIDKLEAQLIEHEKLTRKPYRCSAGKLTIGVGRNIEDRGISTEEAMFMLANDIDECVNHCMTISGWDNLSDVRKRVLVEMCFQLGWGGLSKFKATLAAVAVGDFDKAAQQMRSSLWYRQTTIRAERLALMMERDADVTWSEARLRARR